MPGDTVLTEHGADIAAKKEAGKVLLLACGALAREILALISLNGWVHLELKCLPAKLHLFPERIPQAVKEAVEVAQASGVYRSIYVVYADCGTGGLLDKVCDELGVQRIAGPHCYSFFDGNEAFARRAGDEMTAFYLTDFLVKQFDAFVWKPMGLDRHPQLRDMLFGNYTTLIYLAQEDKPELIEMAREQAARLGLRFEHRATGYGELAMFMAAAAAG